MKLAGMKKFDIEPHIESEIKSISVYSYNAEYQTHHVEGKEGKKA